MKTTERLIYLLWLIQISWKAKVASSCWPEAQVYMADQKVPVYTQSRQKTLSHLFIYQLFCKGMRHIENVLHRKCACTSYVAVQVVSEHKILTMLGPNVTAKLSVFKLQVSDFFLFGFRKTRSYISYFVTIKSQSFCTSTLKYTEAYIITQVMNIGHALQHQL